MGESVRKCIERWEIAVQNSNAANVLPEIEIFFKKIGDNEDTRSNVSRRIYSVFVKHVTLKNVSNLMDIFKYLTCQSPSYTFSYFLPVLFNKTLELEKAVSALFQSFKFFSSIVCTFTEKLRSWATIGKSIHYRCNRRF